MIHGRFDLTSCDRVMLYPGMFTFARSELHETCIVQKHWNHATNYVETKCVRRIVSEIHLVCRPKIVAISCSSTGVLLCTWNIIYSIATGLAPKARTTSKPFLYTTS